MKINIMFLIFSFNVGGIERLLIDLCNNMASKGHHIYLCIINDDYTEDIINELSPLVNILYLKRPIGSKKQLAYMQSLSKLISNYHIQILHCQGINCVLFSALAKLLNPHIKILNTVHDSGNYSSYSSLKIAIQNQVCSMTIAISNSVQKEILLRNINPLKVTTIYNAINTTKFQLFDNKKALPLRDRNVINLCNVARFFPAKKGQDILVKAVEQLLPEYPAIHCYFAGEVFKGQECEYNKISEYLMEHKLTNNVSFCGSTNNIPDFLSKMDIFILPSRYEGFGISLIEAMSTGLPCIASKLQGPEEIINSPKLGLLFDPDNTNDLVLKIKEMINNYESFDSKYISNNIKDRFSIESSVQKHLQLYKSLL